MKLSFTKVLLISLCIALTVQTNNRQITSKLTNHLKVSETQLSKSGFKISTYSTKDTLVKNVHSIDNSKTEYKLNRAALQQNSRVLIDIDSTGLTADAADGADEASGARLFRLVIYWICIGFFIDLAIYMARFKRHMDTHDEFHAALMVLTLLGCAACDIWWIVRNSERAIGSGADKTLEAYFFIIIAANL